MATPLAAHYKTAGRIVNGTPALSGRLTRSEEGCPTIRPSREEGSLRFGDAGACPDERRRWAAIDRGHQAAIAIAVGERDRHVDSGREPGRHDGSGNRASRPRVQTTRGYPKRCRLGHVPRR